MQLRRLYILIFALILIAAVTTGIYQAVNWTNSAEPVAVLENVRDVAPATVAGQPDLAVDSSGLYIGRPGEWVAIPIPPEVIPSAVAVDRRPTEDGELQEWIYLGAANELAIYRTGDRGANWLRVPLAAEFIGGVTDLAVDPVQRLLYVGTDTAGVFRLRDVGSSMIIGGQLLLDAPVRQVAVDANGSGLAFARTDWTLYRAENFGLRWSTVENLHSSPTAIAIAGSPATVYVGTVDRGVLKRSDGLTWAAANDGLGVVPGSRLHVDSLAVDPLQPQVLYVATSFLYGSTEVHHTPSRIAVSTDGALAWAPLEEAPAPVAELLPVGGQTGALYVLTTASRTPAPVGEAEAIAATAPAPTAMSNFASALLAWLVAGLAAVALVFAVVSDLRSCRPAPADAQAELEPQTVRIDQG